MPPSGLPYFNQGQSGLDAPAVVSPIELDSAANLRCWLDVGAETGFNDADTLTPWSNQIVGEPAKSNFTANSTPTYETNELDGEAVVEFSTNGTDYYFSQETEPGDFFFDFMHKAASSFMCIFKPENHIADSEYQIINNNNSASTSAGFELTGFDGTPGQLSYVQFNGIDLSEPAAVNFGTWYVAFFRHNGVDNAELWIDNVLVRTDTIFSLSGSDPRDIVFIGRGSTTVRNEYAGQISQILFWDADVESDRQALHDYFADRFPTLNL